jgi:hypothetical protein
MTGEEDGCSLLSTYEDDREYAGVMNDDYEYIDKKYEDVPYMFTQEGYDGGLLIVNPDKFGCMFHEEVKK